MGGEEGGGRGGTIQQSAQLQQAGDWERHSRGEDSHQAGASAPWEIQEINIANVMILYGHVHETSAKLVLIIIVIDYTSRYVMVLRKFEK